jgi:hypothetical protein
MLFVLAVVGIAWVGVAFGVASAAKDSTGPGPYLSRREVTKPDEKVTHAVWRNGKFHYVTTKIKRYVATDAKGGTAEVVEDDVGDVDAQLAKLPPVDPALAGVGPTPEQEADAKRRLGIDDSGARPMPPRPGDDPNIQVTEIPRKPTDPPSGDMAPVMEAFERQNP